MRFLNQEKVLIINQILHLLHWDYFSGLRIKTRLMDFIIFNRKIGMVFIYGTFIFHYQHIADLIVQNKELRKGWDSDGASGLVTLFFGWLLSLIYRLP